MLKPKSRVYYSCIYEYFSTQIYPKRMKIVLDTHKLLIIMTKLRKIFLCFTFFLLKNKYIQLYMHYIGIININNEMF